MKTKVRTKSGEVIRLPAEFTGGVSRTFINRVNNSTI